jgi:hypothetical protein
MRPDQGSLNTFSKMAEDGQTILRHILEGAYPGSSNVSRSLGFSEYTMSN